MSEEHFVIMNNARRTPPRPVRPVPTARKKAIGLYEIVFAIFGIASEAVSGLFRKKGATRKVSSGSTQSTPIRKPLAIVGGVVFTVILAIIACRSGLAFQTAVKAEAADLPLAAIGADATATPTPFMPLLPTFDPALLATDQAAVVQYASDQQIVDASQDVTKILVLGSDARPDDYGFRTDTIILVMINRKKLSVSAVSFPRDLYLDIPGWGTDRINTAYTYGGFEAMAATFEENFGIRPDHYVLTNFQSFVQVVDSLGGLDVNVPEYLDDQCEPPKTGWCSVNAGMVHMDGEVALWYARSRRTTSDFARIQRGQIVLKTLFFKLMSIDAVGRFQDLYGIYKNNVETDMKLEDLTPFLPVATNVFANPNLIQGYVITPEQTSRYFTDLGADVLLPDLPSIKATILQAMSN